MEACGAAHHWARMLTGLGHDVKLVAPEAVKPFVKKGKKNDAADAAAICTAASRPDTRLVPTKSLAQQGVLALHSVRSLLVKQQTMLANAIRGLVTEFGLTAPKGIGKLGKLMTLVDTDETIPGSGRRAVKNYTPYAVECGDTAFSAPFRRLLLRAIAIGRRRETLKAATLKQYLYDLDRLLYSNGSQPGIPTQSSR